MKKEKQVFLNTYLSESSLQAFARGDTEQIQRCFIQLPQEPRGRYAAFQMNMIEAPNTGDITGILSVTDVTDQTVSGRDSPPPVCHQPRLCGRLKSP